MKQKLMHNLNLKVLAVLFSIIIWVIVVNIDDPVKSVQFNDVPIQVLNESALEDENLCYEIVEGQREVNVSVSGRRSVIEDLSKDNITVTADLNQIKDDNTIPLKIVSNKYSGEIDTIKPEFSYVDVEIEELKKIQKVIQVETIGEPSEGYIEGDYSVSLNRVNIEGPKSIVDMIQSAKVQIDVEGATNSVSASAPIYFYDALGEKIDPVRLKTNLETISVSQEILFTKSVNITCVPGGDPEEGYKENGEVIISPSTVILAGPKSVLDNINQVTIPTSAVNISGQSTTYRTSVNIFNYLPSGLQSAQKDFRGNVTVSVGIEEEISRTFNIYLSKVGTEGLPEGMSCEIINGAESATDNRVELTVYGLESDFDNISSSDIKLSADFDAFMEEQNMESIQAGIFTVPVKVVLPNGLRCKEDIRLRIRVSSDFS